MYFGVLAGEGCRGECPGLSTVNRTVRGTGYQGFFCGESRAHVPESVMDVPDLH